MICSNCFCDVRYPGAAGEVWVEGFGFAGGDEVVGGDGHWGEHDVGVGLGQVVGEGEVETLQEGLDRCDVFVDVEGDDGDVRLVFQLLGQLFEIGEFGAAGSLDAVNPKFRFPAEPDERNCQAKSNSVHELKRANTTISATERIDHVTLCTDNQNRPIGTISIGTLSEELPITFGRHQLHNTP